MKRETYTSTNTLKYYNATCEIMETLGQCGFSSEEKVENLGKLIEDILKKHFESEHESETYDIPV